MSEPLTFPTFSQLTSRGWKVDAMKRVNLDLMVSTSRDKKRHILNYTWTATRYGALIASGVAYSRGDCVHAAYAAVFVERRA